MALSTPSGFDDQDQTGERKGTETHLTRTFSFRIGQP
jgi:hypothetical protein